MPQAQQGNVITTTAQVLAGVINSEDILDDTIVDADIKSDAAIAFAKLVGVAALGANSDSTSLAGLTTPLSLAQGGIAKTAITEFLLLIGNGASAPAEVAIGSADQVLTSKGAGVAPAFEDAAAALLKATTANVTISEASTTETTVMTVSVPGGTLGTANAIRAVIHLSF